MAHAQAGDEGATIHVKVIDQVTGVPIEGAQVRAKAADFDSTFTTNAVGTCDVVLPSRETIFVWLYADAPGCVPMRIAHSGRQQVLQIIPEQCAFEMVRGTTIGGTVVDEDGKPVPDAAMTLDLYGAGKEPEPMPWIQKLEITAGPDGKWSYDRAPQVIASMHLKIVHPSWCRLEESFNPGRDPELLQVRYADMLAGQSVHTLKRGALVKGHVRDEQGTPIAGASIMCREDGRISDIDVATTNEQGEFSFRWEPQRVGVIVRAEGRAPDMSVFDLALDQLPLEFTLKPGAVLRGRVVNPSGEPIPDVQVSADNWRQQRFALDWRVKTDAEGRFEWTSAPNEPFTIECYRRGLMRTRVLPAVTNGEEMLITVHPELRIVGTVTDAQTGSPIESFTVIPGAQWGENQPVRWFRPNEAPCANGKLDFAINSPQPGHALMIEAPGYAPFESQVYSSEDGLQKLDVKLEAAQGIAGLAKHQDGSPAAGATILVATNGSPVFLHQGKPMESQSMFSVTADDEGKFSLPPQTGTFWIVGIDDVGYAMMTDVALKEGQPIVLQPWCRIEGVLIADGEPVPGRAMDLDMYRDHLVDRTPVNIRGDATTDTDGRFVFERVPPGLGQVTESIPIGPMMSTYCRYMPFEGAPGETMHLSAASGATVTGRLVAPSRTMSFAAARGWLSRPYKPPVPDGFDKLSQDEQQAWHKNFNNSDEGARWRRELFRTESGRAFFAGEDGTFTVDGVKPGTYDLEFEVFDAANTDPRFSEPVATLTRDAVEIPDVGASRTPVDLGEMEVEVRLGAGDLAPLFETKTVDGEPLKLADFAGKYVFLDFWAVWCGPCKAEIPNVRAAYQALKDREDFVIISLSLDNDPATPREYAKANDMPWVQGFLGKWADDTVAKA